MKSSQMSRSEIGVWAWGALTTIFAGGVLFVIIFGSAESRLVMKDSAPLIGGILAAGALAWTQFFQASNASASKDNLKAIESKIDALSAEVAKLKQPKI